MTSLDPTHIPGFERTSDPTTGQAVKTSVSNPTPPSWKGAWKRRQEAKLAARHLDYDHDDSDDDDQDERARGDDARVPIPPIPDLRYEQGILSSIRPFLHSSPVAQDVPTAAAAAATARSDGTPVRRPRRRESDRESLEHELKVETAEHAVLASAQLTAEGQAHESKGAQSDALMGPLRIEWGMVTYVLVRDQVVFPLLQGVLWGMAGIYLNGLWDWNRRRLAAKSVAEGARATRGAGPGLLSRLGLAV